MLGRNSRYWGYSVQPNLGGETWDFANGCLNHEYAFFHAAGQDALSGPDREAKPCHLEAATNTQVG